MTGWPGIVSCSSRVAATSVGIAWTVGTAAAVNCRTIACAQAVILRWNGKAWN